MTAKMEAMLSCTPNAAIEKSDNGYETGSKAVSYAIRRVRCATRKCQQVCKTEDAQEVAENGRSGRCVPSPFKASAKTVL